MDIQIDKNLKDFVKALIDRSNSDWDTVIAIAGEERSGKSSLAVLLGLLIDKKFDLVKNIAYLPSHAEIEEKFKSLVNKQVFAVDEAIKAMYKMRFMDKLQSRINEMYATEAWMNKITLLCIPRFTDLNEFFRNHRVKIWIQVVDRGLAVAFAKDERNVFHADPWYMKENDRIMQGAARKKKYVEMSNRDAITAYMKSQNFYFHFTFDKLPDKIDKKYKDLKKSFRGVTVDKERNLRYETIIGLHKNGMEQKKIAEIMKCSQPYVSNVIKESKKLVS